MTHISRVVLHRESPDLHIVCTPLSQGCCCRARDPFDHPIM